VPVVIRTEITNPKVAIFFMQSANEGVVPDKADTEQSLFCSPLSAGGATTPVCAWQECGEYKTIARRSLLE
jgi:hypothetical protein